MEASDVERVYLVTSFLEQVSLSSFLKQVSQAASIKYLKHQISQGSKCSSNCYFIRVVVTISEAHVSVLIVSFRWEP